AATVIAVRTTGTNRTKLRKRTSAEEASRSFAQPMKDMLQSPCAKIRQAIGATPWPDQSEPWRPLDFIFGVIDLSQSTAADSARPGPSPEKESVMSSCAVFRNRHSGLVPVLVL